MDHGQFVGVTVLGTAEREIHSTDVESILACITKINLRRNYASSEVIFSGPEYISDVWLLWNRKLPKDLDRQTVKGKHVCASHCVYCLIIPNAPVELSDKNRLLRYLRELHPVQYFYLKV